MTALVKKEQIDLLGKKNSEKFFRQNTGAIRGILRILNSPITAWIFLFCSLSLTFIAWRISSNSIAAKAATRFEFQTKDITGSIGRRMQEYESVLRGGVALFAASRTVSRQEWRSYVSSLELEELFPGIQGLGFSKVITPGSLASHVAGVRSEGFPDYKLRPDGDREIYTSIIYLEPFSGRNLRAFGFDMFSEPIRRSAMESARDTGRAALSGMVTLVQETDKDVQHGMLMYLPVYRQGQPTETVADRRTALEGYVYSPFRIKDLMRGVLESNQRDVSFQIFDGDYASPSTLMYDSENIDVMRLEQETHHPDFSSMTRLSIAGQTWNVYLYAKPGYLTAFQANQPRIVAGSGAFIDVLLYLMIASLARQRRKAVETAKVISQTKQRLSEAHRIAMLGYIEIDPVAGVWTLGEGTQEMLNIDKSLSIGRFSQVFVNVDPEDQRRLHDVLEVSGTAGLELEIRIGEKIVHVLGEPEIGRSKNQPTFITLQDITHRRAIEQERAVMLERMAESSRLESLGTLAGGVAHEINTPCQFIGDNLSFVEGWLPRLLDVTREARTASESGDWALTGKMANAVKYDFAAKELPAAINQALGGLERIASIVQAIKTFAYPSTKTMEPFNLNNVVELAATVTRNKWKTVADLNLTLAPDLPFFCGLEGEISQVLVNLIVNAVDAIVEKNPSGSGRIDIATRQKENWIELSVADTGNGISEENNNKIFELFFTTKAPGKGTGQGLAISKAIVLRHGGSIDVESEAGVGTCFHILLPIAGAPVPDPA